MTEHPSERPDLLAAYLESTSDIELLLAELSETQLESRESPDEWTVRQIVHHLTDVEVGDSMRQSSSLRSSWPPSSRL